MTLTVGYIDAVDTCLRAIQCACVCGLCFCVSYRAVFLTGQMHTDWVPERQCLCWRVHTLSGMCGALGLYASTYWLFKMIKSSKNQSCACTLTVRIEA